ncbi:MAG: hypothetical protein HKO53_04865 [Gemmatimonadetes bacterium]|nr:hypothetical protein [Gemmatimonadota bacterium]
MEAEQFPNAMDHQIGGLRDLFGSLTDEDMVTIKTKVPGGGPAPLGLGIFLGPGKWLTGYRMQLFLYAKAAGNPDIGTANCWAGVDPRPK